MSDKITRKQAAQASDLHRLGLKILHYRRDVMPAAEAAELETALNQVEELREDKQTSPDALQAAVNRLDKAMRRNGATFYPKRALSENVEMLFVAAILAIGVRTYFVQPYRIPTNSMYPTYNGMTGVIYETEAEEPSLPMQVVRGVTHGATHIEAEAPVSGEISIPLTWEGGFRMVAQGHRGRKWFGLLPEAQHRYTLQVGGRNVYVDVPAEFDFQQVMMDRFGRPEPGQVVPGPNGSRIYNTGVTVKAGDPVISFDVLLGDQLFVDRFSYHFIKPEVGTAFVFRTDKVPGIAPSERGKYYVKRLVAEGGDTLQVKFPVLYRNGEPITGAEAFDLNARQVGEYEGYLPSLGEKPKAPLDEPFTLPPESFFAMGDNSDRSSDSRVWGIVPEDAVIGRPLFIYWPFAQHFGPAR